MRTDHLFVITGGPGSGKSSLIAALAAQGLATMPEAGRVVFALPYGEPSLVGTTDIPVERPEDATVSREEIDYLCEAVNRYFAAHA